MLRVLHVHSGNMFGGVERVLLALLESEEAAGTAAPLRHEFALCFEGEFGRRVQEIGGVIHRLTPVQTRKPWTVLAARRRLEGLLEARVFDVVMTHSTWAQAIFGDIKKKAGRSQAFWLHDVIDGKHWLQRWAALHRPDIAVANSRFTARGHAILYRGIRPEVVYCPAQPLSEREPNVRESVRDRLGIGSDYVVIAQLGRLEPLKGQRVLIEALGLIAADPRWICLQLTAVSSDADRRYQAELQRLAGKLGVADRVMFVDPSGDVPSLLAASDIYCQPNTGPEGFGLTLVEALQAGLPVVTSELGGAIEAVGGNGWLLEPGNSRAVAATLSELINNPQLRSRFSEAGRAHALTITDPASRTRDLAAALEHRPLA